MDGQLAPEPAQQGPKELRPRATVCGALDAAAEAPHSAEESLASLEAASSAAPGVE